MTEVEKAELKNIGLVTPDAAAVDKDATDLANTKRLAAEGKRITDPTGSRGVHPVTTQTKEKANAPAAPAKASATPAAPAAPKTTLRDMKVGSKDGNQTLVDKKGDGSVQLWSSKTGKFGVVKVVNNKYTTLLAVRADEKTARDVFEKN